METPTKRGNLNPASFIKTHIKKLFTRLGAASARSRVLPALITGLGLMLTGRVTAQTFTTLHNFSTEATNALGHYTNSDGVHPEAVLILSGNTLYGTVSGGGTNGYGTVFAVNANGTGFTNLHNFSAAATNRLGVYTNSDGATPYAGLILSGNTLYGTAELGGTNGYGTVFAVNTNGAGFTTLHGFSAAATNRLGIYTNSDGANPVAVLILSGNTLYGTAYAGGTNGYGTVFAINTNGTGFTNLHTFTALSTSNNTNSDGANPYAGLILSGNTLYGTAELGGTNASGTVFAVNTNGTGFTNLYSFTGGSDGAYPDAGLLLSGNTLYGTADGGGINAFGLTYGTVFAITTNGTRFTNPHTFTALSDPFYLGGTNSDGVFPHAGLILSGNTLYGTASYGGTNDYGTVFGISLAPQLTINLSGTNVILTWPANATVFTLESTTNLVSPAVWNTNSTAPIVISAQNVVTNPISGAQKFYRLSQ